MIKKIPIRVFLSVVFLLSLKSINAQLKINEYSCANFSINDNFGNPSDWFEIYNPAATAANISGYYVSDDKVNLQKFQFPFGTTIPAGGFIRVWASGKDTIVGTNYHTKFKLTQCKPEQIIFADAGGFIVDSLTVKRNQKNHSWGRTPDGSATWKVYTTPTPNATNTGTSYIDYLKKPVFSLAPGFYPGAQVTTITTSEPNTIVYYTTTGADPTTSTTFATGNVAVNDTMVIRAIVKENPAAGLYLPSFIETNSYFINVSHTLPIVSVAGDYTSLFNSQTVIENSFEYFEADKTFKFETTGNSDKHGNDSWAYAQKGFDYVVDDRLGYHYTNKYQFFTDPNLGDSPRDGFQRVILKAAASDNYAAGPNGSCHMRDAFCQSYAFKKGLHLDGRRTESVIVYINGKYWGVYELREKFDEDYTDFYYNQPEIDNLRMWGGLTVADGSATGWNNFYTWIMANNMAIPANYAKADSAISFTSLIDYISYNTYVVNSDFINWNSAWWRGHDMSKDKHKWRYWMWDMDNTWGLGQDFTGLGNTGPTSNPCDYSNAPIGGTPEEGHFDIFNQLMVNQTFKSLYINRYADLLNTALNCNEITNHFNYYKAIITPEMQKQITRWPAPGASVANWNQNLDTMQAWINRRCSFIDSVIKDCYNVSGPFDLCVDVFPANSGTIQLNTITPTSYLWTGQYFGGVNQSAIALPGPNYVFEYWEVNGSDTVSSLTNDSIQFYFDTTACIKAHFRLKNPYELVGEPMVPSGFTPNGDGNNDLLNVFGTLEATEFELEVYNRWGELVFKSNNKTQGWDGNYKGSSAPVGVYGYRFNVTIKGQQYVKSGNVTLIR